MKVYVDTWIYGTEQFVNVGNIELYEEISRYEKADYPPIPNFISIVTYPESLDFTGFLPFSVFLLQLKSIAYGHGFFNAKSFLSFRMKRNAEIFNIDIFTGAAYNNSNR